MDVEGYTASWKKPAASAALKQPKRSANERDVLYHAQGATTNRWTLRPFPVFCRTV